MYILIGGNPFRGYTGTMTYTSLSVVDTATTLEECRIKWRQHYEDCGGLMLWVDGETGKPTDFYELFGLDGKEPLPEASQETDTKTVFTIIVEDASEKRNTKGFTEAELSEIGKRSDYWWLE